MKELQQEALGLLTFLEYQMKNLLPSSKQVDDKTEEFRRSGIKLFTFSLAQPPIGPLAFHQQLVVCL